MALLIATALPTRAADLLQQVPRDALGFVVVRDIAATDAKARTLFGALQVGLPGPLAMLRMTAGIEAGLDRDGDLLVVLLPAESSNPREFHLAVWLPVDDYAELVRSLDGDPQRRIAAVTVAGEDLLATRHGDWAVVMDPDQRDRLIQLREAANAAPTRLADWRPWIDAQDAAVVILPSGMPAAWQWATRQVDATDAVDNDPFGPGGGPAQPRNDWWTLRGALRSWLTALPEFSRWAAEVQGAAVGLRVDAAGNAVANARLALPASLAKAAIAVPESRAKRSAPRLYGGDEFVVQGSGDASRRWTVPAVAPYVRQWAEDLASNYGTPLEEADLAKFRAALESAVGQVEAFAVLTRPGKGKEAVFTNNLLAVRVKSASDFSAKLAELMGLWNEMLGKSEGPMRLVFESEEVTIVERQGTEYSIDMAAAVGAAPLPELRETMERLFGTGGALRLQFVTVDSQTVLLAAATREQVAQAIGVITRPPAAPDDGALGVAAKLLETDAAWRIYYSPHDHSKWLQRQMTAMLGPVIGGPVVREFPASPPLGLAGGVEGQVLWVELAVPAETLGHAGDYVRH